MPSKNSNARSRTTLHAVPGTGATVERRHTAAEDKLWHALHAHPGSTTAELADHAGIGRSTAGKILAAWAADGGASRMSGIAQGGRRAADTWTISATDADDTAIDDAQPGEPEPAPPIVVMADEPDQVGPGTVAGARTGDTEPPTESTVDDSGEELEGVSEGAPAKPARLGKGALRGMVEDFLTEHPGEAFSPGAIGKALSRSSGAVANALDKLVADGYAVKVQDAPKRYTAKPAS